MVCLVWSYRALASFAIVALSASPCLAQQTTTYTYDPQGQVKTVTRPTQTVTYSYDAAANRTQMTAMAPLAGRADQAAVGGASPRFAAPVIPPPPTIPATPPPPPFPPPPPAPISPLSKTASLAPVGNP